MPNQSARTCVLGDLYSPDLAAIACACACGVKGIKVRSADKFETVLQRACAPTRPFAIDVTTLNSPPATGTPTILTHRAIGRPMFPPIWKPFGSIRACGQRGFTLLELLVVMVIIGMLAAYVAPRYFSQVGRSQVRSAQAQIAALRSALDAYRLDVGSYPTTEQGLTVLTTRPNDDEHWNGPYLQRVVPLDPWGRPYQYKSPGEYGEYDLFSLGKDGQPGGSGDDADITSWQ